MNKYLIITICLSLCSPCAFAQEGRADITLPYEANISGKLYTFAMSSQGSYYLHDQWLKGDVHLTTGKVVRNVYLKYNAYIDELIWLPVESYEAVQADKKLTEAFVISLPGRDEQMVFRNIPVDVAFASGTVDTFVNVLYEGSISLLVHRRVIKTRERLISADGGYYPVPVLEPDPVYYIVLPDGEVFEPGRFTRRALYGVFPGYRDEIRSAFRRDRLLRIRTEDDMIHAVSLIDSIID